MINVYVNNPKKPTRDFHVLWEQIITQLKQHEMSINVINAKFSNIRTYGKLKINDCELLIDYDKKFFKAISLADYSNELADFFSSGIRNAKEKRTKDDVLLLPQANSPYNIWSDSTLRNSVDCNILGGIYTPLEPNFDFSVFRQLRKEKTINDKFIFKGNVHALPRSVVPYLTKSIYYSGMETYNMSEYLEKVSEHKIGLCIPGAGELCHRDIEYMAIGIPMMKFEYLSNLTPPLIPNVHYISIPRIDDHPFNGEREGGKTPEVYADLYISKFLEVKDDHDFLSYISQNAMEYYDKYLHPTTRVKHIFNLWNLPFFDRES